MNKEVKESLRRVMRASTYWLPDEELEKDYEVIQKYFSLKREDIFN